MQKKYAFNQLRKMLCVLVCLTAFVFAFKSSAQTYTTTKKDNTVANLPGNIYLKGYIESLPPNYNTTPLQNFPLLIALHGNSTKGNGSSTSLDLLFTEGIPKRIQDNTLPTSFVVNGKQESLIILAPQLVSNHNDVIYELSNFITTCLTRYRVDPKRVYLTGLGTGAGITFRFNDVLAHAQQLAAIVPVRNGVGATESGVPRPAIANISTVNLPVWATHNEFDPVVGVAYTRNWISKINASSPTPTPAAISSEFNNNIEDAWTETYNPATRKNGLNVYEWMLQFSNDKIVANAGLDQGYTRPMTGTTPPVTLDGTKSKARDGRIASYSWTQVSGATTATISSASSAITSVSGLTSGKYEFELTVTHDDATTATDRVVISTQGSRKVLATEWSEASTKGYIESLPPTYYNDPTKKFPLIIFHHGKGHEGSGTEGDLNKIYTNEIPKLIAEGRFPASFNLDDKDFSFIVICPQRANNGIAPAEYKNLIDYCLTTYRVDPSRIYMTGLSRGGGVTFAYPSGTNHVQQLAALLPVCASKQYSDYPATITNVVQSNLPVWATSNNDNTTASGAPVTFSINWINQLNAPTPNLNPVAKIYIFPATDHNAWTRTYNPDEILDNANGYNAYEWMLQYTNEKLVAKAGKDQPISTNPGTATLDGSRSMARGAHTISPVTPIYNRVASYEWRQLSGPSTAISSTVSTATHNLTGLVAGTYQFELKVTHSVETTLVSRDTVAIVVASPSPRQAGPEEKLDATDASKEILDVTLNPNPVRSNLTVFVSGKATGNTSLAMYNLQGQKVSQQQFNKPTAQTVARNVQVSNLPSGAYAIQVILAGKTKVIQFIKE